MIRRAAATNPPVATHGDNDTAVFVRVKKKNNHIRGRKRVGRVRRMNPTVMKMLAEQEPDAGQGGLTCSRIETHSYTDSV